MRLFHSPRLSLLALTLLAASSLHASQLPKEVVINDVEFVLIPAGEFYKSGGIPEEGKPFDQLPDLGKGYIKTHLPAFYMAKHEARARDLVRFLNSSDNQHDYELGQKNCSVDKTWYGRYEEKDADRNLPATHLSWNLTKNWADWMGFRLPTEDEWERAARGSDQRAYPWGNQFPDDTLAGFGVSSYCHTWPVDDFRKGVSPFGVYNMAGNVREYVWDWYSQERDKAYRDDQAPPPLASEEQASRFESAYREELSPARKIIKGGRWAATGEKIQISARVYWNPDSAFRCNGARFALDTETVQAHLDNGTATITQH